MTAPIRARDKRWILVIFVLICLKALALLIVIRWALAKPIPSAPPIDSVSLSPGHITLGPVNTTPNPGSITPSHDNITGRWTVDICEIGNCASKPPWNCNTNESIIVFFKLDPILFGISFVPASPDCKDTRFNVTVPNPWRYQIFDFSLIQILDKLNRTLLVQGTLALCLPSYSTCDGQTSARIAPSAQIAPSAPISSKDYDELSAISVNCTTSASVLPGGIIKVKCPKNCNNDFQMVWGSDPYTTDSSVCKAGIHMGNVGNDGGTLIVLFTGKQANFMASVRNGVSTLSYEEARLSFTTKQHIALTPTPLSSTTTRILNRQQRDANTQGNKDVGLIISPCSKKKGGSPCKDEVGNVTLWYNSSSTQIATYVIDFCQISACPEGYMPWECTDGVPKMQGSAYLCVVDDYWGDQCNSWGAVGWNTRGDKNELETDWGYKPESAQDRVDRNGKSLLTRLTLLKKGACNSLFIINIENPGPQDQGTYLLGSWVWGRQSLKMGRIHLKDISNDPLSLFYSQTPEGQSREPTLDGMRAIANPTFEDTLAIEAGITDPNIWVEWARFSSIQHNKTNCYVCGSARPHLGTVPFNIPPSVENCFLGLFTNTTPKNSSCEGWAHKYPIITKAPVPGDGFTIYKGSYTCYRGSPKGTRDYGTLSSEYCASYSKVNISQTQQMTQSMEFVQ